MSKDKIIVDGQVMIMHDEVGVSLYDLEDLTCEEVAKKFSSLVPQGMHSVVKIDYGYGDAMASLIIRFFRPETPAEKEKRLAQNKLRLSQRAEKRKKAEAKAAEKELELYNKLKKKYEGEV